MSGRCILYRTVPEIVSIRLFLRENRCEILRFCEFLSKYKKRFEKWDYLYIMIQGTQSQNPNACIRGSDFGDRNNTRK